GLPPRSRARAPLRGRRPLAAVHLPQALARPRTDRDLLLHPRGDHARARVARRALRPPRRAGGRERGGDGLPRGAALPALRREAPLRARVLVALRAGRRNPGGLRRAAQRAETGELLRSLFFEGTRPTSEEVAARLGYEPLDVKPLVDQLNG